MLLFTDMVMHSAGKRKLMCIPFKSGQFQLVIFSFGFQQFDYVVLWRGFILIDAA